MSRETKTANFVLPNSCIAHRDDDVMVTLPIDEGKELWEFLGEQYQFLPKSEWSVSKMQLPPSYDYEYVFTCENCHTKYKYMPKYCMECGAKGLSKSELIKFPYKE